MRLVTDFKLLDTPKEGRVGFVPTMGALHKGHLELLRIAKLESDFVIISLFVNPLQFGKGEDFEKYPRDLDRDIHLAESMGVNTLFMPSAHDMYPSDPTTVNVPKLTDVWEGAVRPGHFVGVATIVAKLFNIVRPHVAFFGQKDLQQCLVIERLVRDLNFPINLRFLPTFREPDGLAMSSRNVYLSKEERAVAPLIYEVLMLTADLLRTCTCEVAEVEEILRSGSDRLHANGFVVDYLQLVDLDALDVTVNVNGSAALIVAARLGNTRLIDNLILSAEGRASFS